MIDIVDFSNCELSSRNLEYAGRAGEKKGIIYNSSFWFLKFPKNTVGMNNVKDLSYVTSPLSEYIGSNIYRILGFDVHETILGVCFDGKRYKVVCACKDFIIDDKNEIFIPYTALRNDTSPEVLNREIDSNLSTNSASNIHEIIFQLSHNSVLKKIDNAKERFWDCVVIDLLINNNDRNEDNWGVIKYKNENIYKLSPIFDCGGSFYGKTGEDRIKSILSNEERLMSSALNGVTAYVDNEDNIIRNDEIIKIRNDDLNISLEKNKKIIKDKFDEICCFINSIPSSYKGIEIMSDIRKEYYIKTMKIRFDHLINL